LNIEGLFKQHLVTADVQRRQSDVKKRITAQVEMLQIGVMPKVPVGKHCFQPYPCDFMSYCWSAFQAEEILQLSGLNIEAKLALIDKGYRQVAEIPSQLLPYDRPKAQADQNRHLSAELGKWLNGLQFPIVFFDIEFLQLVVPVFEGTHPYESIPFMLSAHQITDANEPSTHQLAMLGIGEHPFVDMAKALVALVAAAGSILTYDAAAELRTMHKMVNHLLLHKPFPEYQQVADDLLLAITKVKDLRHPFLNLWISLPEIGASNSLKKVLPVMCPGQDFSDLDVNDGFAAARQCEIIFHQPVGEEREMAIKKLNAYAERDTWAMYSVWKALNLLWQEASL
jgi:hypothetical protein